MNERIRAILRQQPNLAEFARKSGVPYYTLYYFLRTEGADISAENAEKVLKAGGGK